MVQSYHQLDEPKIWCFGWCEDHQTISFNMYSPDNAQFIGFDSLSMFHIGFYKIK